MDPIKGDDRPACAAAGGEEHHRGGRGPSAAPTICAQSKGYVRGFDVRTGKRKWIFHTIPRKGEFGYDTWTTPGQAKPPAIPAAGRQMSADPELGLVYVPVELPRPTMLGITRAGADLFGETLVALDIETGQRKWHYQIDPSRLVGPRHSLRRRSCATSPITARSSRRIAQPSKQGCVYVLDRTNGKPVLPIPEKQVPKGDVPGEWYSPTQPIPSAPPPFAQAGRDRGRPGRLHARRSRRARWRSPATTHGSALHAAGDDQATRSSAR